MKKKIFVIFVIFILIISFGYLKVQAENNVKQAIKCRFTNHDITDEYKIEIKDNADRKIIIKIQDMKIIECYADNGNQKLDLRAISRITYSEPNNSYFLYIENLTDNRYQLDYTKQYQYSIYENNKLKKEVKTANAYIDKTKGNLNNSYYIFDLEYDKTGHISNQALIFGAKAYIITYIVFLIYCIYMKFYGTRHLQSKRHGGVVNEKRVNYCREIQGTFDLESAYASLYYCSKVPIKKLKNGIIGAFLLKWSNEDNIAITDNGNKVFSIDLLDGNFRKTEIEQELYNLLKIAAGDNNIINNNELKIWSRKNKEILENWHKKLLLNNENINLKPKAESLIGLKKFLLDYSLIEERKHIEVKLWENYLIYAQLFGIADEVTKQFSKIYPDYSKIGQLSVMNLSEIAVEYMFIKMFLLIPMALSLVTTILLSVIYYIVHFI